MPQEPEHPLEIISYISLAREELADYDLELLLRSARRANRKNGITGSLLYRDGTFIQVFEGPTDKTEILYEKIKIDRRHTGLVQLFRRPIETRYFSDWSMAYKHLSDSQLNKANTYTRRLTNIAKPKADDDMGILAWVTGLVCDLSNPRFS